MQNNDAHNFKRAAPELVERIRRGESDAFELFYRMEFLNLVHFADSYLHDAEKARDIAQETLLSVWDSREKLDPGKNFRAFVFTVARNKTIDELQRRRFFGPADGDSSRMLELLEDNSVEERISALGLPELLEKIWRSLPSNIGRTFEMSRSLGLKNREIAERDGVSLKTVEYRIKVALRRFRKFFGKVI